MECNKDDALRAKEIAEKRFLAKDLSGARKFALKAQNLNPGLEGINQMLATLDVHIAAQTKINGEGNFYGILGVSPVADDDTIRKHYRKLALLLHPDKNKSLGAEAAFKEVSEAWSLLSDKGKKSVYDSRNANFFQQKVKASKAESSQQTTQNGFYHFAKNAASRARPPKPHGSKKSSSSSGGKERNTFWTVCYRCKMQYEYMRMYLNHNLLCPNCHEAFYAVETTPPSDGSKRSTQWNYSEQRQGTFNDRSNFQWGPFSKTAGHASAAQAANVVQQAYQKVKRERQEAQAATKREEALKRKNRSSKRPSGALSAAEFNATKRRKGNYDASTSTGARAAGLAESEQGNRERVRLSVSNKLSSEKEAFHNDVKHLLVEKARKELREKLSKWKSDTVTASVTSREVISTKKQERTYKENHGSEFNASEDHDASCEQVATETKLPTTRASLKTFDKFSDTETVECISIDVPDSDFHNFDSDRTESCFGPNQVWAAYDDSDGMPRYYALILKVISSNPFKAKIRWLNSSINSDKRALNCVNAGFPRACGHFGRGRHEIRTSVDCFSHKMKWTEGLSDTIQIFPRTGEVWALYRNWSPKWNEFTEYDVIQKYDLVEVLEDYNEDGVVVMPLVKVTRFKAVYHKHLNPKEIRKIPGKEMLRFSHQILSCLLTGNEGPNAPRGCQELDAAAMPGELLKVIQDVDETECMDHQESKEGVEGPNALGGCQEVDPTGLPVELKQDVEGTECMDFHESQEYVEHPNSLRRCLGLDPAGMPAESLKVIDYLEETECMDHQGTKEENLIGGTGTSCSNSREETCSAMDVTEVIIIDS